MTPRTKVYNIVCLGFAGSLLACWSVWPAEKPQLETGRATAADTQRAPRGLRPSQPLDAPGEREEAESQLAVAPAVLAELSEKQPNPEFFSSDTHVGRLLNAHLRLETTTFYSLAEAQRARDASLARLRDDAAEAARMLAEGYALLPPEEVGSRRSAASTLAALDSDEAYEALRDIALEPLPEVNEAAAVSAETRTNELALRITAMEGLTKLARRGHAQAEGDLLEIIDGSLEAVPALRVRAALNYVRSGADRFARQERVRHALPEALAWTATGELPDPPSD